MSADRSPSCRRLAGVVLAVALGLAAVPLGAQSEAPTSPPSVLDAALAKLDERDSEGAIALLEPLKGRPGVDPRAMAVLGALYIEAGRAEDSLAVLEPLARADNADPAVLYNAGRAALAAGKVAEGETFLTRSLARAPVSPAARELGLYYGRIGRSAEALALLERWVTTQPEDSDALMAAAQAALRLGRADLAEALISGLNAESDPVRVLRAQVARQRGDAAGVLAALGPIAKAPPPGLERDVRRLAGEAYLEIGRPQDAIAVIESATVGDAAASLVFARAMAQLGRGPAAIAALKSFADWLYEADPSRVAIPPLAGEILVEYGRQLEITGQRDEAIRAFKRATVLASGFLPGWESLAAALTAAGRAAEAKQAEARVAALRPRDASTLAEDPVARSLAESIELAQKGETSRALTQLRQTAGTAPGDPRPLLVIVRILIAEKRWDEALKAADAVTAATPERPADGYYLRGVVRMASGNNREAETELRRALAAAPNHVGALNDLAVLLMTEGRSEEAQGLLEKVLALVPGDPLATDNLKKLREAKGGKTG
ncbi:MAG TPA: tetratricopeptide repeat protein [Thermoanaerobaculia bacterium]|nr:tetratricopeptide repeat protein [Thermoanaerobaculia bacterium]